MNATELRIGNIVTTVKGTKHYGKELEVENIIYNNYDPSKMLVSINDYPETEILPIPITEEWLKRMGFTKQIGWSIVYKGEKFQRGAKSLEIAPNGTWYAYVPYVRNFNTGEPDDFVCLRSDLMHVHQLQNLYHALTGEELEIK